MGQAYLWQKWIVTLIMNQRFCCLTSLQPRDVVAQCGFPSSRRTSDQHTQWSHRWTNCCACVYLFMTLTNDHVYSWVQSMAGPLNNFAAVDVWYIIFAIICIPIFLCNMLSCVAWQVYTDGYRSRSLVESSGTLQCEWWAPSAPLRTPTPACVETYHHCHTSVNFALKSSWYNRDPELVLQHWTTKRQHEFNWIHITMPCQVSWINQDGKPLPSSKCCQAHCAAK